MRADGRGALLGLALLCAGCPAAEKPRWTVVSDGLDRVALSVWGARPGHALVVGGGLGNGAPGMMLALRDGRWSPVDLGSTDSLWWVSGLSETEAFAVGERGAIYRFDGVKAERQSSPTTATLFGIWGSAGNDLWAVGGTPHGGGDNDVILHFDGSLWSVVEPPSRLGLAFFKVWGSSRADVFIAGQQGRLLHYDGSEWTEQVSPARGSLLTVAGSGPEEVYAVGGPPVSFLRFDGRVWSAQPLPGIASGLTGVSLGLGGSGFVVGLAGVKWRRPDAASAWVDEGAEAPRGDLHAVWAQADGSALAVGGNYLVADSPQVPRKGVIAYFGTRPPPAP